MREKIENASSKERAMKTKKVKKKKENKRKLFPFCFSLYLTNELSENRKKKSWTKTLDAFC